MHATHPNASLTPAGRLKLARLVVEKRWTLARAAERFSVSITTARRWADRYRLLGAAGMVDRSSRPHRCPHQLSRRTERRILGLRVSRRWGPARIAYHLGLHTSTVHKVLQRYRCPRLKWTDPATGARIKWARAKANSYLHAAPGDLVHVDIKKLGRIPDGGGWRIHGRGNDNYKRFTRTGYRYIHSAIDDCTRLVYSEIHHDEQAATAVEFWTRAEAWFASWGIRCERVLTDNGACYKSRLWHQACAATDTKVKKTRPRRPQTNGKIERFHRILLEEWAYIRPWHSDEQRHLGYQRFLHFYNHHRAHGALGWSTPAAALASFTDNLPADHS